MTYEQAKKIYIQIQLLKHWQKLNTTQVFNGEEAKKKVVNEACLVACEALDILSRRRPCVVYSGSGERKGIFHGFSDNNDKCVIEFEDGELHKAYIWQVAFLDKTPTK